MKEQKINVIYSNLTEEVSCEICGGSGELIIRNAYDETFEGRETCWKCSGTGIKIFSQALVKVKNQ